MSSPWGLHQFFGRISQGLIFFKKGGASKSQKIFAWPEPSLLFGPASWVIWGPSPRVKLLIWKAPVFKIIGGKKEASRFPKGIPI